MTQYLVFLRGINVGGKSMIKMAELRDALERREFTDVSTYIQSGNVFVSTPQRSRNKVAEAVSKCIAEDFNMDVSCAAFTKSDWQKVVSSAPDWWGRESDWKHDLLIVVPPSKLSEVVAEIGEPRVEVEATQAGAGVDVIYASIEIKGWGRSSMSKIIGKPVYKKVTVRNYNTSTKLLARFS